MRKAELRKRMLQQRLALPAEEVQQRSQRIADTFFRHFPLQAGQTVHVFLPILKNNEVNTWPIIERLRREYPEVRVAVPVMNAAQNLLTHHHLTDKAVLVENAWGIPEPQQAQARVVVQHLFRQPVQPAGQGARFSPPPDRLSGAFRDAVGGRGAGDLGCP